MIGRSVVLTDRPNRPFGGYRRLDCDTLTDVLRAVRMTGAIFFDVHASTPWVAQAPPSRDIAALVMPGAQHVIEYHVLVSGSCWAALVDTDADPIRLAPGSIIVFPHGDPHVLSSAPHMRAMPEMAIFAPASTENPRPFYLDPGGGGPQGARIVCGFLGCDARPFNPLLLSLPRVLHIAEATSAEDGWLGLLVEATLRESEERRIGGGGVLSKLSELIFIETIRRYAERQGDAARSWLAGLNDPLVGRAIRALHRDPGRAWTLNDLAREVGSSRTALADRFAEHVGMPPMTYLTNWRMQIAAAHLADRSQTMARIAATIGYESEAAFSRAFKRCVGMAPSEWRRATGA